MQPRTSGTAGVLRGPDAAWTFVAAISELARAIDPAQPVAFSVGDDARPVPAAPDDPAALLVWRPERGWDLRLDPGHPEHAFIELYLPLCAATASRPITIGHLGQSLDGFIATHAGDSQFVTGPENILHLHRMRALSDAVVVGAGTVAADDPLLTTRQVTGPNALRVVFDPGGRLDADYRIFSDAGTPTLYVTGGSEAAASERFGTAKRLSLPDTGRPAVAELLSALHARGCHRVFVEGGGVTVSSFLQEGLLDRLQMAVAPLIVGSGKPAIRLEPKDVLSDCARPSYRVYRMGGDVLFDCDLTSPRAGGPASGISRVI